MRKELTSQQLREMGLDELALYQEQGPRPHEESADSQAADPPPQPERATPLLAPGDPEPSSVDLRAELKRLLGPLVSPLLRDSQGRFDPSKIRTENFEEFKQSLRDQVSVDGIAFNQHFFASYHQVLGKAEHEPLLRLLWEERNSKGRPSDFPSGALQRLTADLVAVSAERFVSSHLNHREGRRRLRGILGDSAHYSRELRIDVTKAIASVGDRQGIGGLYSHQSEKQISSWNYFNWGVSDEELKEAGRLAEEILSVAEEREGRLEGLMRDYRERPEKTRALITAERTIKPEEIRRQAIVYEENRDRPDPVSQIRAHLARFWLMAADSENWREDNAYASSASRLYLLAESERLLSLTENVRDEAGLLWLNERVQEFLAAPLPSKAGSEPGALQEAFRWLEHKVIGRGLEELFEAVPEGEKAAYLQLKQLSDRWKHASEMGEKLFPEVGISPREKAEPGNPVPSELRPAISQLAGELHKTKHQFWYHYKQHKALSRGASNVASWFGAGDIEDIREANRWIDGCLRRLAQVQSREDLEKELNGLSRELKKDGKLFAAMQAAEMEGTEQLIGLLQTVAEIAAITLVTEGMGTAGAIANAARAGRAMQGAVATAAAARRVGQGAEVLSWAAKAQYGMKMGMAISATENAVAVGTGEVREGPETLLAWGKDSLTTGAAMSLFGPLAMGGGSGTVSRNLGKDLLQRYAGQGAKGLGHLAKDTAAEAGEELFDAQLRQGLDGRHGALSADQIREITLVSGFGGAQMGALGHGFKLFQQRAESAPARNETAKIAEDSAAPAPSEAAGKSLSSMPWRNLLLSPMWMFLGAGGAGGLPPGRGGQSAPDSVDPAENEAFAKRLAAAHARLEPIFAKAGQPLTLRDLLLAGKVTAEMSLKLKALSMEESLRIVYAYRLADAEKSEAIQEDIRKLLDQKLFGSSDVDTVLREKIRLLLNKPEVTGLRGVYEALAELEGERLFSWIPRVLRYLSREELDEVLDQIAGTSSEEAVWILNSKNPAGGPRFKTLYLKAAREGVPGELDIFAGREWDLGRCLRDWGLVDEEVIQEFREGVFHDQELNRSHHIWALAGLGVWNGLWDEDLRDYLLEYLDGEASYVENIDEAAHFTLKIMAFRDKAVADHLGYSGPVEAYWHSWESGDAGQRFAALEIYKQLDLNEKKMVRSQWISRLESRDEEGRQKAVTALRELGESSPELRLAFSERLEDESDEVRFAVAMALVSLGLVDEAIKRKVEQVLAQGSGDQDIQVKVNCAAALRKLGDEESKASLLDWLKHGEAFFRESTAKALGKWGLAEEEFQPALQENLKDTSLSVRRAAELALDQLFPEWGKEFSKKLSAVPKILFEELSRIPAQATQENEQGVKSLEVGLPQWTDIGSSDSSRWEALIPERQKLFMSRSTTRALQGLVAGILTHTPLYLIGETGTGKNAILRHLANVTGTPLLRINFNRETDHSQLYGHFEIERDEQGQRRVVLRDGKMIQAMKHGAWVLWDEANLASEAFLVAQNDLIQQIQTGKVTVRQGGKPVTIEVHPHFRLFATGNPEGYVGRKATERSFGNRWLKIFVQPMPVEEQQAFLATEYMDLSPESAESIPAILHALKIVLGGERVTIRTLKRVAARIQELEAGDQSLSLWKRLPEGRAAFTQTGMRAYVRALEAEVLDGLNPEDYENAVQVLVQALPRGAFELKNFVSQGLSREEFEDKVREYAGLLDRDDREGRRDKEQEENPEDPEALQAEMRDWGEFVPVPTFLKYAAKALDSLIRGDHLLLEGPPATSKSSFMRLIGRLAGQEVIEATGSADHSTAEMIGMPALDEQGNLVFQEGYFLKALKEGAILVLNEANLIPADVLERLNSVFDDDRMIVVSENGHEAPVQAHPNFRLVLTQNPAGMNGGRKRHSPALENKFRKIFIRDLFLPEELSEILRHQFPDLKAAAPAMAELHAEIATVMYQENHILTLRDLKHWGIISSALQAHGAVAPDESLILGAKWVFAGRAGDRNAEGRLSTALQVFREKIDKTSSSRSEADTVGLLRRKIEDLRNNLDITSEVELWRKIIPENEGLLEYFEKVVPCLKSKEDVLAVWNLLLPLLKWHGRRENYQDFWEVACLRLLNGLRSVSERFNLGAGFRGPLLELLEWHISGDGPLSDISFLWILRSLKSLNLVDPSVRAAIDRYGYVYRLIAVHVLDIWDKDLESDFKEDLLRGRVEPDFYGNPSQHICFLAFVLWKRGMSLEEIRPRLPSLEQVAEGFGTEYPFTDESSLNTSCLLDALDRMGAESDKLGIISSLWERIPREVGKIREDCFRQIAEWVAGHHIWSTELERRLRPTVDEAAWLNFKYQVEKYIMSYTQLQQTDGSLGLDFHPNFFAFIEGTWSPEEEVTEMAPGDNRLAEEFSLLQRILAEELGKTSSAITLEKALELSGLEGTLQAWPRTALDSSLGQHIPAPEKLFLGNSSSEALHGLIGGILASLPVYLLGETGTGKNAMLRYLAHQTGTPLLRINFNRETDASQLYGHFEIERDAQGIRRVVLRDGKMIQAMRHGAWVLWDEANLASEAFLVAQNDLIQQIQSGKVTVRQGGKLVTIEVHPHFRLFAAGNPEGYAGRKATERSFGNRWLKIFVKPMPVEEQQAYLAAEYRDLSPRSAEVIPAVLHALKIALGGERVTLRTLKRVARRVAERETGVGGLWEEEQLSAAGMEAYVAAIQAEVLDGLNPEDYEKAVQALAQALPRGNHAVSDYLNRPMKAEGFFAEAEKYRESVGAMPESSRQHDAHWEDLVPVPTTVKYAEKVLDSFQRGDHILIEGPPAMSKSAIPKWLGKLLQQPVIEVTGSPDHSASEMIGMPSLDEEGNLIFQEGYFLSALKEGAILILNEANLIPAEVLERLNSVFDDDKMIVVSENGHQAPVQAHPNFRLVLTQNPTGMNGGRKRHSPALENKFRKIYIRDAFAPEELALIARASFPALAPAAEEMARFHQEAARVFAGAGIHLTLRDLSHWGLIAAAFTQTGTLPPHEALALGAELAYANRNPDAELREKLQPPLAGLIADLEDKAFPKENSSQWEPAEAEAADPLRQNIRRLLKEIAEDPEAVHLDPIYRYMAELSGLDIHLWLSRVLRGLSSEEFQGMVGAIGEDVYDRIESLSRTKSPAAVDLMLDLLNDEDYAAEAIDGLGRLGVGGDKVRKALIAKLRAGSPAERMAAATALGNLRPAEEPTLKALRSALQDEDIDVRLDAAKALNDLDFADDAVRDVFLEILENPREDDGDPDPIPTGFELGRQRIAAEALLPWKAYHEGIERVLNRISPYAFEEIRIRLRGRDETLERRLLEMIAPRKGESPFREISQVLDVTRHLISLGLHREEAKSALLRLVEDYPWARGNIAIGLASLGESSEDLRQMLLEALRQEAEGESSLVGETKWAAAEALDRLFPGWDREIQSNFQKLRKILAEELSQGLAEVEGAKKIKIESLLKALPKWEASLPPEAPDPLRQTLRRLLQNPELHDPIQLQQVLAKERHVAHHVWMGYFLKEAPPEELEAFLDNLPSILEWKPWPEEWIGQMGLRQGLPYLLRSARIQHWDHHERRCAAFEALGQLGVKSPEVEAVLEAGLKVTAVRDGAGHMQTSAKIPRLALRAVRRLGLKPPAIQGAIQKLFTASHSALRREAAEAWAELGLPVPPELSKVLMDRVAWSMGRVEERVDAARALGLLRHSPAAEALCAALADSEDLVGVAAAEALGRMGLQPEAARRHLRLRLENIAAEVRIAAAQSLTALGWGGEEVERILRARLKAKTFEERGAMALALGALQPMSPATREALLKVLQKDRHIKPRLAAARALGQGPERIPEVEVFLENTLRKGDPDDRHEAWEILGDLAWQSPEIERLLLEGGQGMPWDRAAAARGLAKRGIHSEAARQALLKELADEWGNVAFPALEALNQLFPDWDREWKAEARQARTVISEELARKPSELIAEKSVELGQIERGLPHWQPKGLEAAGLAAYVPEELELFLGNSTAQALQGLVGGILAKLPVYLLGETGTGKNAMLRYLAHRTGTPLLRINFNRETDASQLYGHFEIERDAQGKRRVVLRDGKMVQAMKHGAWVLWDEANLASEAFLVAQNDLIQQIQTGHVTVHHGGKLVTVEVHPHFRLFSAGNPEGYAGRKATERSFGNRWLKIFVRPMPVEEQQAYLSTEYQGLSPRSAESLPAILHALKIALGGERVTLRTLKRVARRIAEREVGAAGLWEEEQLSSAGMEAYVAAIEAEVLDGLNPEDYEKAVQALAQALPRGDHAVSDYLNRPVKPEGFFAEVEGYRDAAGAVPERPLQRNAHWEDLVPVPTTLKYAQKVLDSFRRGDHILIEGPPAMSKSAIPKWLGKLLQQPVIEVTGSPDHSASEMIGMPTLDEQGNLIFQEGYFLRALKEGAILILNEANLIPAEVLERLNSVFDDDKMIVVSENGHEAPVKAHPNFRLVLTQNPAGMNGGRKRHSPALENKFRKIYVRDAFSQEELEAIVGAALGRDPRPIPPETSGGGGGAGGPEGPRRPRHRLSPAAHPLPARVSPAMGAARYFAAVAPAGHALASVFERKRQRRSPEAPELSEAERKRLEEKAAAATEEVQARIEAFMREHGATLENLGSLAAMKRVRVRVDIDGEVDLAALNLDTGEMRINALAARELSPGQIAAVALHEGGHGAISRIGDGFFFERRSRHLLANCLEDPRVNEYALARLPGARGDFASLYEKFFPRPKAGAAGERPALPPLGELPHEQFALGFLELWANGEVTERVDLPEVREALESLAPLARRIWGTHPHLYHPQEKQILAKQNEVYALIREKILPVYEGFYQGSLEILEKGLREGGTSGRGSPARGIDAEDLSAEARELLERRAGSLAERLEPREASGRRRKEVERARRRGEAESGGGRVGAGGGSPYRESDFKPYGEKTVADLLKERGQRKAEREAFYDGHPWRRYFDPVAGVAAQVAELLRQVLKLDADFDYQGHYTSGPRLDVRKTVETILKNEAGIFSEEDLKLFLRKRFPTRRSHRFVLLLDESGSMKGEAQGPALQAAALFLHVLEGLRVDHAVAGFSDTPNLHKDFQDQERTEAAKNALMAELESAGGGGTNDLAGLKLGAELLAGRDAEEKTVIVITDGAGVDATADYVKELEAAGVKVVGIGVGAGTESVTRVYGDHYHSPDFRDLPKTLLRILTRRMLGV